MFRITIDMPFHLKWNKGTVTLPDGRKIDVCSMFCHTIANHFNLPAISGSYLFDLSSRRSVGALKFRYTKIHLVMDWQEFDPDRDTPRDAFLAAPQLFIGSGAPLTNKWRVDLILVNLLHTYAPTRGKSEVVLWMKIP
jgi:hypothetical protein